MEGLWGEGTIHHLPTTLVVREESGIDEPLPGLILIWGGRGVHALDDTPGHGRGINLQRDGRFPPGASAGWTAGLHGLIADIRSSLYGGHPVGR